MCFHGVSACSKVERQSNHPKLAQSLDKSSNIIDVGWVLFKEFETIITCFSLVSLVDFGQVFVCKALLVLEWISCIHFLDSTSIVVASLFLFTLSFYRLTSFASVLLPVEMFCFWLERQLFTLRFVEDSGKKLVEVDSKISFQAIYIQVSRNSRPEVFCKKGFLRNFAKFTGKHLCQRLFINETLFKKSLWHRCFPINFAKFLRAPFLQNSSGGCFWVSTVMLKQLFSQVRF